jgi:hypothetical protein
MGLTIEVAGDAQEAVICILILGGPLAHRVGCQMIAREQHLRNQRSHCESMPPNNLPLLAD